MKSKPPRPGFRSLCLFPSTIAKDFCYKLLDTVGELIHSGLLFGEVWTELPTITWWLVMCHLEKRVLYLFGSRHLLKKMSLFCLHISISTCAQIIICNHLTTTQKNKKCTFLTAAISIPCSVEKLLNRFYGLGPLSWFIIVFDICVWNVCHFCQNELCFFLPKYAVLGNRWESVMP